jgi:hypothetical protein
MISGKCFPEYKTTLSEGKSNMAKKVTKKTAKKGGAKKAAAKKKK